MKRNKNNKKESLNKRDENTRRVLTLLAVFALAILLPTTIQFSQGNSAPGRESYVEAMSIIKGNYLNVENVFERAILELIGKINISPLLTILLVKITLIIFLVLIFAGVSKDLFKEPRKNNLPILILILSPFLIALIKTSITKILALVLFLISIKYLIKQKKIGLLISTVLLSSTSLYGALASLAILTVELSRKRIKNNNEKKTIGRREIINKNKTVILAILLNVTILCLNITKQNVLPDLNKNLIFEFNQGALSLVIVLLGLFGLKFIKSEVRTLTEVIILITILRPDVGFLTVLLILTASKAIEHLEKREWHLKELKEASFSFIILLIIIEETMAGATLAFNEPNIQEVHIFQHAGESKGGVLTNPSYDLWLEYFGNKKNSVSPSEYNKIMNNSDPKNVLNEIISKNIQTILISDEMKKTLWNNENKKFYFIITHNKAFTEDKEEQNPLFEVWNVNLTKAKEELTTSFLS